MPLKKLLSIRLPENVVKMLPPASLTGERAQYIRDAVKEKLERDGHTVPDED